jgi:acetylornithine/succinyldiaminopimelate/putrescine aminotransferase
MRRLKREKVPFISRSHWLSTGAGSKMGYLLNRTISRRIGADVKTNVIFANSEIEALSGAIRLSRQRAYQATPRLSSNVMILDHDLYYQDFYNPCLRDDVADALCPQIFMSSDFDQATSAIREGDFAAGVVVQGSRPLNDEQLRAFIDECHERNTAAIVVQADHALEGPFGGPPVMPDVLIHGDNLTNHKVPAGCTIMSPEIYELWNNSVSAAIFMSTWAGNTMSLESALDNLDRRGLIMDEDRKAFAEIDSDYDTRVRYFTEYVHPPLYRQSLMSGFALETTRSEGMELDLADGRNLLDYGGGLGCSLRGQNPVGYIETVLDTFDPREDQRNNLEKLLGENSRFSHVLPGISGASAVDNAISAAMMANPSRRKIVTFTNNYSGKTLLSVNMSRTSHIIVEPFPEALAPYYSDVVYIDPSAADAAEQLRAVLTSGEVALVWFEITQGYMCEPLPDDLIDVIVTNKASGGYLVGVDEVLTGMFRDGVNLLHHTSRIDCVDVVSMSKATSDIAFPVSWALITDEVYERARKINPAHAERLKHHYAFPLGLHVGRKAVEAGLESCRTQDVPAELKRLRVGLERVAQNTELFEGVSAAGNLLRFNLNSEWFPFDSKSFETTVIEMVLTREMIDKCGVMLNNVRIFPPNIPDVAMNTRLIEVLDETLGLITPLSLYTIAVMMMGEMILSTGIPAFLESRGLARVVDGKVIMDEEALV